MEKVISENKRRKRKTLKKIVIQSDRNSQHERKKSWAG